MKRRLGEKTEMAIAVLSLRNQEEEPQWSENPKGLQDLLAWDGG